MDTLHAVLIAEGDQISSEDDYFKAWQHLIDTGTVWNLQGWFGRTAADMISGGFCIDTHNVMGANPYSHTREA